MSEQLRARRYFVSGIVQGVGYRYFVLRVAERLGLAGYVKNRRDGRVEIYAIAPPRSLAALRAELERGPRAATVSSVAEVDTPIEPAYSNEFSVEYDA